VKSAEQNQVHPMDDLSADLAAVRRDRNRLKAWIRRLSQRMRRHHRQYGHPSTASWLYSFHADIEAALRGEAPPGRKR